MVGITQKGLIGWKFTKHNTGIYQDVVAAPNEPQSSLRSGCKLFSVAPGVLASDKVNHIKACFELNLKRRMDEMA